MSFCQIVIMIFTIVTYQLAPIAFVSETKSAQVASRDGGDITATKYVSPNFWIGPDPSALVLLGAKYTGCLRNDTRIWDEVIAPQNAAAKKMGCCTDQGLDGGNCFSALQDDCLSSGFKTWSPNPCGGPQCCKDWDSVSSPTYPNCERFSANETAEKSCSCSITARPCCLGLVGKCEIQSLEYCDFFGGTWHDTAETCDQVFCMSDVCGLIPFFTPGSPDQWYRLYLALFIHVGIIHLLVVLLFQHSVATDIEKLAGWFRMSLIYCLSGAGGYTVSCLFTPYEISAGASPALYGLLGCLFVELFQSWRLLPSPKYELCKLMIIALLALAVGLLPYVDNWSQIGGFLFGVLSSIVFLPYITFGKWDSRRKKLLLLIALPSMVGLFVLFITLTATNQLTDCTWCGYLNCIDFVPNFCRDNQQLVLEAPIGNFSSSGTVSSNASI